LLLVLFVVMAIAGIAIGGRAPRPAFAQTPPPGPILGTGDFIDTSNRIATATWEEYSGGMLYVWNTTYVTQAFAGGCTFSGAVCYKWIQYIWSQADAYNTSLWTPFQRGCMVLGADPLAVGEADGLSRVTDLYAAGTTYIPVLRSNEGDATLNPAAAGTAPFPGASSLPVPWDYDHNCGSGGGGGGGGCTSWAGTWSTSYGTMQLSQSGASVTGNYESNSSRLIGTASGNTLKGTWSELPTYTAPDDAGDFQFTMSADGTSFSGGWRYGSSGDFTTDWTGTRSCTSTGGCTQYSISGAWQTNESNNYHIMMSFTQNGTTITGTARFTADEGARAGYGGPASGTISGTLVGNQLDFVVTFTPKRDGSISRGHYTGTVSDGSISGTAKDDAVANGPTITWTATGPTRCVSGGPGGNQQPGPARPAGVAGTWDANNGVWTFTQNGNNVTASIAFSGGLGSANLQGTFSNGTIKDATYQCNSDCPIPDHGTVTLTLSSNGCSMQGSYTNSNHITGQLTMTKRGCSGWPTTTA